MNKLLLVALLGLAVVVLAQNVELQPYEFESEATINARFRQTKCHESCICELTDVECANCNKCTRCVQSEGTQIVGQDFCQCLTPEWRQARGPNGEWKCERVVTPPPKDLNCEWQIFNQVHRMVVHSDCRLEKIENADGSHNNYVVDVVSFDWRRLAAGLEIVEACKGQLTATLLWAYDCATYVALPAGYSTQLNVNQIQFKASLIDVYQLTNQLSLTADGRTIYQRVCLAVELGNERVVLRQHRFELRVYTNRDQVEVFHLNIDKQYTEGCDKGQECIVVANLDTRGLICNDSACSSFKDTTTLPNYTIGQHLYVRIQFKDSTYTNYLQVQTVKFVDNFGIFTYQRGVQWGVLRSEVTFTDVDIYLFQPHQNALVEVALKIALVADNIDAAIPPAGLRALATSTKSATGEETKQTFENVTVTAKPTSDASSFSAQLFCGFALAALALLF